MLHAAVRQIISADNCHLVAVSAVISGARGAARRGTVFVISPVSGLWVVCVQCWIIHYTDIIIHRLMITNNGDTGGGLLVCNGLYFTRALAAGYDTSDIRDTQTQRHRGGGSNTPARAGARDSRGVHVNICQH